MTILSGTALAGIFIFSGILFPFLNGRQSTGGKYLNAYHCNPKLKIETKSIRPVFNPGVKRGLICFLAKRIIRIFRSYFYTIPKTTAISWSSCFVSIAGKNGEKDH